MSKLEGKVAVVTGGSSGIGLAAATRLVSDGAYVFITGRRKTELDAAVGAIGRNVAAIQGDVSKIADLDRIFAAVKEAKGRVDVLFANAGIAESAPLDAVTEDHFDRQFDVNVKGTLFTVQKALPLMPDGASVILTSSIVGSKGGRRPKRLQRNEGSAAVVRADVDGGSPGAQDPRERREPRRDRHTRSPRSRQGHGRRSGRGLPRPHPAGTRRASGGRRRRRLVSRVRRQPLHHGHRTLRRRRSGADMTLQPTTRVSNEADRASV
jgi:NAD(P)-dependent dehydrogenase (short-subunit alcohol dehydrogenase family)